MYKHYLDSLRPYIKRANLNAPFFGSHHAMDISYINGLLYDVEIIDRYMVRRIIPKPKNDIDEDSALGLIRGHLTCRVRHLLNQRDMSAYLSAFSSSKPKEPLKKDETLPNDDKLVEYVHGEQCKDIAEYTRNRECIHYRNAIPTDTPIVVNDVFISEETMGENDGLIYVPDLDVVITSRLGDPKIKHPMARSEKGTFFLNAMLDKISSQVSQFAFRLIDNEGKIGRKFVNIMGVIVVIDPVIDKASSDGMTICYKSKSIRGDKDEIKAHQLTPEEVIETNGYFSNYNDAKRKGTQEWQQDQIEKELKHKTILAQNELNDLKMELDKINHERAIEKAKTETELDRLKHDNKLKEEALKDYYSERDRVRKDVAETSKSLPNYLMIGGAIITAVATVVGAIFSIFRKKEFGL